MSTVAILIYCDGKKAFAHKNTAGKWICGNCEKIVNLIDPIDVRSDSEAVRVS